MAGQKKTFLVALNIFYECVMYFMRSMVEDMNDLLAMLSNRDEALKHKSTRSTESTSFDRYFDEVQFCNSKICPDATSAGRVALNVISLFL